MLLGLAVTGCQREQPTTSPPKDEHCTGARCVEQAEAAMYYGDHEAAREPLVTACELGDGFQCDRLAALWHHGQGGPVNLLTAAKYYEEGCAKEFPEACERRALLAAEGHGGPPVELEYWIKACDGRRAVGCVRAGQQLGEGRGVERDHEKGIEQHLRGCDLGDVDGCVGAGDLLMSNPKPKADAKQRALAAYINACVGHSGYGCLRVGVALHEGIGAPKDVEKAKMHFGKACEFSIPDGCHVMKQFEQSGGKPVVLELTSTLPEVAQGGLEARKMSCRMSDQSPLALHNMLGRLARYKYKLDECAKDGAAIRLTWDFEKGKVKHARIRNRAGPVTSKCVTDLVKKARMPKIGNCEMLLMLGDAEGATKSLEALVAKIEAKKPKDNAKHIHVTEDDE